MLKTVNKACLWPLAFSRGERGEGVGGEGPGASPDLDSGRIEEGDGEGKPAGIMPSVPKGEYLQYGGQAIIEGVMMRSPRYFSVAARAPNGEIVVHTEAIEKTWIGRQKWLKLPFLRGSLAILDAMALGYRALRFSTDVQLDPRYQPAAAKEADAPSASESEETSA